MYVLKILNSTSLFTITIELHDDNKNVDDDEAEHIVHNYYRTSTLFTSFINTFCPQYRVSLKV